MSSFTDILLTYFLNYNILFLSILIIVQCIGIPSGATLLVIASGAFAYAGEFNIILLLLEIWLFSCIGDSIAYLMWKTIGNKTLNKSIKLKTYFEPKITKAQSYLDKYGKSSIFISRFLISAMGPFVNAAAGIACYNILTFILFVAFGELLWTCIYLGLGFWFGDSWESVIPIVTQVGEVLTYITILGIVIYLFVKMMKTNKKA
ncbi:MAG: DedA family protein [Clostridiaceae bacterium]